MSFAKCATFLAHPVFLLLRPDRRRVLTLTHIDADNSQQDVNLITQCSADAAADDALMMLLGHVDVMK